jgi:hypothetical protein
MISEKQQAAIERRKAPLSGKTQAEAEAWINDYVNDLTTAKERMVSMAKQLVILQRQIDALRNST